MENVATGGSGSQAYAWHFDMLHDDTRIDAFAAAFERLPKESLRQGVALDIGCGSGVLGMLLLKKQQSLRQVIALDVDTAVVKIAKENAVLSRLEDKMLVHAVHSTRLSSLLDVGADAAKVPLLVCEILDAGLLGEDCIRTLRHSAENLLTPGYHAVPARADIYACAVESHTLTSWQHLHKHSKFAPRAYLCDDGDGNPHDVAFDRLLQFGQAKVLTPEFRAIGIDFESLPSAPAHTLIEVEVSQSGRLDAIVFWWRCFMVRGDRTAAMTNAPCWAEGEKKHRRGEVDHWRQAVCVLPRPYRQVLAGERIVVAAMHDDSDIWFRLAPDKGEPSLITMPTASTLLSCFSYERMWMLDDMTRLRLLRRAIHGSLSKLSINSWQENGGILIVDLSDGPILSIFALQSLAKLGVENPRYRVRRPFSRKLRRMLSLTRRRPKIMCLESSAENMSLTSDFLSPLSCKLARMATSSFHCAPDIDIVEGSPMISPKSVSLMMAEPYSQSCEGQPCDAQLWQHWAQVDALGWTLADNVSLVPSRFRVMAILVHCPALWHRRQQISSRLCSCVDVSAINKLHPDILEKDSQGLASRPIKKSRKSMSLAPYRSCFAAGMWQNHHTVLGDSVCICEVDLRDPMPQQSHIFTPKAQFRTFHATMAPHAVATWVEIEMCAGQWLQLGAPVGSSFPPSYNLQGVLLALDPSHQGERLDLSARFDPNNGSLQFQAAWNDTSAF